MGFELITGLLVKVPLTPVGQWGCSERSALRKWLVKFGLSLSSCGMVVCRAPKDHINTRILQTMVSGTWNQHVRHCCLCGLLDL